MAYFLKKNWENISRDLALNVEIPYLVQLKNGEELEIPVYLECFGAKKGMFIVLDGHSVWEHIEEITSLGYGIATLSDVDDYNTLDKESVMSMLVDWGWTGDPARSPLRQFD